MANERASDRKSRLQFQALQVLNALRDVAPGIRAFVLDVIERSPGFHRRAKNSWPVDLPCPDWDIRFWWRYPGSFHDGDALLEIFQMKARHAAGVAVDQVDGVRAAVQRMIHVLVNGVAVIANGKMTDALPGKVVRGPGYRAQ